MHWLSWHQCPLAGVQIHHRYHNPLHNDSHDMQNHTLHHTVVPYASVVGTHDYSVRKRRAKHKLTMMTSLSYSKKTIFLLVFDSTLNHHPELLLLTSRCSASSSVLSFSVENVVNTPPSSLESVAVYSTMIFVVLFSTM